MILEVFLKQRPYMNSGYSSIIARFGLLATGRNICFYG